MPKWNRLDVGCGEHPTGTVNVDRYRYVMAKDRTHIPTRADIIADGLRLPFRDESFTTVYSAHTIEHLDRPAAFLAECERIARRRVIIRCPHVLSSNAKKDPSHQWSFRSTWFSKKGYATHLSRLPLISTPLPIRFAGRLRHINLKLRPEEITAIKEVAEQDDYDYLFVLPGIHTGPAAGGYRVVYEIARRLARDGSTVAIAYLERLTKPPIAKFRRRVLSLLLARVGMHLLNWQEKALRRIEALEQFQDVELLTPESLDTIRAHRIFATEYRTALPVTRMAEGCKKYYISEHSEDDPLFSGSNWPRARESYSLPLQKIVTNHYMENRFAGEKPLFLRLGFASDYYREIKPFEERGKSVLFPLYSNPSKGAVYAFDAIQQLRTEMPKVNILGFGNFPKEKLPVRLNEYFGPRDPLYYTGRNNARLLKLYNNARVFVLPSLLEGFSLPTLEAMSCGCATVVTEGNGGTEEYAIDGHNCLKTRRASAEGILEATKKLLRDDELAHRVSDNGRVTASKYSFEDCYNSFLEIMR